MGHSYTSLCWGQGAGFWVSRGFGCHEVGVFPSKANWNLLGGTVNNQNIWATLMLYIFPSFVTLRVHQYMNNMCVGVTRCDYSLPEDTEPALVSLIRGLLHRDPTKRTHTLLALQQEQLFTNTDLAAITQKEVSLFTQGWDGLNQTI